MKQELLVSFSGIWHKQGGIYGYGEDFIQKTMSIAWTSQNSWFQSNSETHASLVEKSARTSTPVADNKNRSLFFGSKIFFDDLECRQKAAYVEKTAHIASAVSEMRGKSIDFLDAVPIKPIVKTMFGFDESVELFSHLVLLHSVLPLH